MTISLSMSAFSAIIGLIIITLFLTLFVYPFLFSTALRRIKELETVNSESKYRNLDRRYNTSNLLIANTADIRDITTSMNKLMGEVEEISNKLSFSGWICRLTKRHCASTLKLARLTYRKIDYPYHKE